MYKFKKEKVETNYLRPRYIPSAAERERYPTIMPLKALIVVAAGAHKGDLCWGIVDAHDNFTSANQQLVFNPWTGATLPANVAALKRAVRR